MLKESERYILKEILKNSKYIVEKERDISEMLDGCSYLIDELEDIVNNPEELDNLYKFKKQNLYEYLEHFNIEEIKKSVNKNRDKIREMEIERKIDR